MIGRCILIDFDRYMLCFCVHCIRLCVVFFIGCLVFSAFLMYFICEFEIVQYNTPTNHNKATKHITPNTPLHTVTVH